MNVLLWLRWQFYLDVLWGPRLWRLLQRPWGRWPSSLRWRWGLRPLGSDRVLRIYSEKPSGNKLRCGAKHINEISNFIEQSPWETDSSIAGQEIPYTLLNLKVHYSIHNTPPLVFNVIHVTFSKEFGMIWTTSIPFQLPVSNYVTRHHTDTQLVYTGSTTFSVLQISMLWLGYSNRFHSNVDTETLSVISCVQIRHCIWPENV